MCTVYDASGSLQIEAVSSFTEFLCRCTYVHTYVRTVCALTYNQDHVCAVCTYIRFHLRLNGACLGMER